ncbi:MAG: AlpA family phage regulatory protein [Acidobacteria bacterium]|nr:AlpA family phage regulatory protein [Acidobacteriota bacterium]
MTTRLLTLRDVTHMTALSRSAVYALMADRRTGQIHLRVSPSEAAAWRAKAEAAGVPRSGLPTSVHDHRIGCSTSPDSVFNFADPVFNFGWIRRSRSPGLRTRTKGKDESGVRYVKREVSRKDERRIEMAFRIDGSLGRGH